MKRALVLGAGMVGSAIARDLAADPEFAVTVADVRADVLARLADRCRVKTVTADLAEAAVVRQLAAEHDLVLGALSSTIGLQTLRAVIEAGRNYCDISFMPEDATVLDALARERGVTAVVDCGVAPGLSNMMASYGHAQLDRCDDIFIAVGGLPAERRWPYEYKAGFSPHDVIEEYTRPARLVEGGRVVVKEALTEVEQIDFPDVGTLEAFNTDGLRSLIVTLAGVPRMREKTLRYPGHVELMKVLRHTGLFSKEPVSVGGAHIRPLDLTAALLFPKWSFAEHEADLTVMRVVVSGQRGGEPLRYQWDLVDHYDPGTKTRSMSRVTAFPATIMARMLASGRFAKPGVHAPEIPAREPGLFDEMLRALGSRGVRCHASLHHDPA